MSCVLYSDSKFINRERRDFRMIPKRLAREVIYESDWVKLYIDKVEYANKHIVDEYPFIHYEKKSVAIVVQNENDEVLLIKSNRYVTQSEEWEIPAGHLDAGETPINAATREVLEETGYTITKPLLIYEYNPSNGMSNQKIDIYKARAIKKVGTFDSAEVADIQWVSKEKLVEMLHQNSINCGIALVGLMMVVFCGL